MIGRSFSFSYSYSFSSFIVVSLPALPLFSSDRRDVLQAPASEVRILENENENEYEYDFFLVLRTP